MTFWIKALLIAAALAALAALVHVYNEHLRDEGRNEVRAEWTAENLRLEKVAAAEREGNAKIGLRRIEVQATAEQRKTDEIAALNADVARLAGELRNRPARPVAGSAAPADPAASAACTGAGLYVQDADFLVREAARAKRVLIEREACHDKYDALTPAH